MSEQNKVLLHALLMAASDPRASREALEELAALGEDPDRLAELTGSAPAERTIGKRRRSFVTKSHKSKAPGADDEDGGAPGADLARWYARWFDALEESGLEPTPDDIAEAEAEMDGSGWSVGRDDSGDWRARPTSTTMKKSWRRLDKAAQRAPAGFTRTNPFHFNGRDYVGGQFIPGKAVESASPADREKLAQAKESEDRSAEKKKQARGSRAVDLEGLKRSLAPAHGLELTAAERGNAARAYAALKRHHGGLTLHRVAELAGKARQALDAVGDDHPNAEGLRDYWSRQLAAIASWVGRAEGEGMTGEAAEKAATGPVAEPEPVPPQAASASMPGETAGQLRARINSRGGDIRALEDWASANRSKMSDPGAAWESLDAMKAANRRDVAKLVELEEQTGGDRASVIAEMKVIRERISAGQARPGDFERDRELDAQLTKIRRKEASARRQGQAASQKAAIDAIGTHYPDGRLVPKVGDEVYREFPGLWGSPIYVGGVVVAGRDGQLMVKISRSADQGTFSIGKTLQFGQAWTAVADPEIARREQERQSKEAARKQNYRKEDEDFAAWEAEFASKRKPFDMATASPGDVVEMPGPPGEVLRGKVVEIQNDAETVLVQWDGQSSPTAEGPESLFTGTLTDSAGRTYQFVDGVRVTAGDAGQPVGESPPVAGDAGAARREADRLIRDARPVSPVTQQRATAGGEVGPNGEWYPGGAFIATTDMPKRLREKLKRAAVSRGEEVAPGERGEAEPGTMPIYQLLQPGWYFNPRTMGFTREAQPFRELGAAKYGRLEELLGRFKAGERFVPIAEYPEFARIADVARAAVAGEAVPGEALGRMPDWLREALAKYRPPGVAPPTPEPAPPKAEPAPQPAEPTWQEYVQAGLKPTVGVGEQSLRQAFAELAGAERSLRSMENALYNWDTSSDESRAQSGRTAGDIERIKAGLPEARRAAAQAKGWFVSLQRGYEADPEPFESEALGLLDDAGRAGMTAETVGEAVGLPNADADAILRRLAKQGEIYAHHRSDDDATVYSADKKAPAGASKAGGSATPPTPPGPHFTGTLTDSAGRTYQFVDGVRVGTDDPASLSENSLDSGDAPGNNAPVDAQPREEPTMPESNETPAAPTPEAAPAPAVNLDDYDHIEGTLKDTPRGRVLEAGEGGLGRQFGRAEIPGLKGHTFAHDGKLWKITAVGNKFERGRGSYRYLYVEPVGDHGPAPAPEPTPPPPPAPAAVAAESGLAPLVAPPGGDYRGYLESVDATRPATLARLREDAEVYAAQWPENAADVARMMELLPTIPDPAFWREAGKQSAATVLKLLKRRPEWGGAPTPPASPAAGPKQPWEMTREEFRASTEKQGRYSHEVRRRRAEQEISRAERDKAEAEARGFPAGHHVVLANRWRAELGRLGEYATPTEAELDAAYRRMVEAARNAGDPVPDDAYGRFGVAPPAAPAPRTPAPQPAPQRVATPAPAPAVKVSAPAGVPDAVSAALTAAGFKVSVADAPGGGKRLTVRSAQSQTLGHIDVGADGTVEPNVFKQSAAVHAALPRVEVSAPAPATTPEAPKALSPAGAPKRPSQMSFAEYEPTHSPAPGRHPDPRMAHWFSIQEALEAGQEVAPAALADHDHYYSQHLAKQEMKKPAAPLVRSVPVRTGRRTLEIRMPPQAPDGVTDRGGGKFQLRRGQDLATGGFATYEPGTVIRHKGSPLIVERAGKPYAARHNGEATGYYQDVDARPPTAEEAAAVARLEAAEEAAEYRRRIADAAGVAPQGTESLRRAVEAYQAALARMNA